MTRLVASRPYVVTWMGNVSTLANMHGELSSHRTPKLARQAAVRQRDALRPMWGGSAPWFIYRIIDGRDGSVVAFIPG